MASSVHSTTADQRAQVGSFDTSRFRDQSLPSSIGTSVRGMPPIAVWAMRLLTATAAGVSGYLAWTAMTSGSVAGCGSGGTFDCSHVLTSQWSTVLGFSVSLPALAVHSIAFTLLFIPLRNQALAAAKWAFISFAAIAAGLAAIWFTGLQVFALGHLCPYCLVAHACGIAVAGIVLWQRPAGWKLTTASCLLAVLSTSGLVAAQTLMPDPSKFEIIDHTQQPATPATPFESPASDLESPATGLFDAPTAALPLSNSQNVALSSNRQQPHKNLARVSMFAATISGLPQTLLMLAQVDQAEDAAETPKEKASPKTMTILNGIQLKVGDWPMVGTSDAKYYMAELLDYTCPHCRKTHVAIEEARQGYNGDLSVIVLPVPLSSSCNPNVKITNSMHAESCEIAKVAIAVWRLKPSSFSEFHHWLMTTPPSYAAAFQEGARIVGEAELKKEYDSDIPAAFIKKNVELYQRAGTGTIPKLLFPATSTEGEINSPTQIKTLVDRYLTK